MTAASWRISTSIHHQKSTVIAPLRQGFGREPSEVQRSCDVARQSPAAYRALLRGCFFQAYDNLAEVAASLR